jgi:hypothetical protein
MIAAAIVIYAAFLKPRRTLLTGSD